MRQQDDPIEAIPEENGLTLEELSAICTVQTDWLILHIEEGFLEPLTDNQNKWRFTSANLIRVRRILELERDFEAAAELAALVADLQEEIAKLKLRLYRAGL